MARVASIVAGVSIVGLIAVLLTWDKWANTQQPTVTAAPPKEAEKYAMDWEAKVEPVAFDAKRAMGYLKDICDIGPRMSATDGMKKQQELMEKHFKEQGGKVTYQKFTAQQRSQRQKTEMANMIVSWKPDAKRRIILCSHYDTRPIADQEPRRGDWTKAFVSANDGGSGVALLMEMAHHMKNLPTNVGVDFVFFDGEEYIFKPHDDYFFGSEYFASDYSKTRKETEVVYEAAILLDMIAGKDLRLPVDPKSNWSAPKVLKDVFRVAADLKAGAFKADQMGPDVEDDHVALNRKGIPAIDLIDFSYKHWHRLTDVPDNCSGASMEQVARVLSVWMQRVK